jgi:hypothetical protein
MPPVRGAKRRRKAAAEKKAAAMAAAAAGGANGMPADWWGGFCMRMAGACVLLVTVRDEDLICVVCVAPKHQACGDW